MPHWRELVSDELDALERRGTVAGVWRRDPSTWEPPSPGGTPSADATGWLVLPGQMAGLVDDLTTFANGIRRDGFTDLILLGMGGSSLGPLVLERTFGSSPGYLRLHVLDSTVPGQIKAVREGVDIKRTLILVSSKSGTTIEPVKLAEYFRDEMRGAGIEKPYSQFIAITDPGTPLEVMGTDRGFRRVFNGQPDVGGRFSVLSHFGLVPAALIGMNLEFMCQTAVAMAEACRPETDIGSNPGAMLGATLGGLAATGKDKVTVLTSPNLGSFGLWIEQLLAESTGKNGRGLVPVAEEPLHEVSDYGDDRNFIYVRLDGDDDAATDAHAEALESTGQPVTRLDLNDRYDMAAEFFRWEFAVAVAATSLSVYPFDQPNIEAGKALTRNLLSPPKSPVEAPGSIPTITDFDEVIELVTRAEPGDYVAIFGYVPESDEMVEAVSELRAAITKRTGTATTFGYGPRYLHSTGQLHKGGPHSVIGLALVAGNEEPLAASRSVPDGSPRDAQDLAHGFESIFVAQALGDLEALRETGHRNILAVLQAPYAMAVRTITALLDPKSGR